MVPLDPPGGPPSGWVGGTPSPLVLKKNKPATELVVLCILFDVVGFTSSDSRMFKDSRIFTNTFRSTEGIVPPVQLETWLSGLQHPLPHVRVACVHRRCAAPWVSWTRRCGAPRVGGDILVLRLNTGTWNLFSSLFSCCIAQRQFGGCPLVCKKHHEDLRTAGLVSAASRSSDMHCNAS